MSSGTASANHPRALWRGATGNLKKRRRYRVALNRIDQQFPADVSWPVAPA
ncbi:MULTISPECIES: tail fiber assembly protein [unclassified Pseudomonas]|uniref:tail fiber assembly protein n=1 Tax=unclassified Pseudomonas TaxID=196821 RepID=UPI0015A09CA1|nr:tail fiber assembly protein [Pseudomonas sp. IPO3779]NWD19824.1 tail fiber assembly protein [Pseudomonas sp. IPO3778]